MSLTRRPAHLLDPSNDSQHGVRNSEGEPDTARQKGPALTMEEVTVDEDFEMKRQPYIHVRGRAWSDAFVF